ncbi:MAG: hypothetical protein ABIG30_03790 [Candidatus Aenigmatarchaeota archaeon]
MVDLVSIAYMLPIPLTIGGAISLAITAILMIIAIVIADYIISHNTNIKHSAIMAFGAYFLTPLIISAIGLAGYFDRLVALYVIPLVVWIILGELLLKADAKKKAVIAIIAFAIYAVMNYFGVPFMIASMIPF